MDINEKIITEAADLDQVYDAYIQIESQFIDILKPLIIGAELSNSPNGSGKIVAMKGQTLDDLIVDIQFEKVLKRFSLKHIADGNRFTKFLDEAIYDKWKELSELHNQMHSTYTSARESIKQVQIELEKQAEAEKKAEAKFEKTRENSIRAFNNLVNQVSAPQDSSDFYTALGWLASHIGTISAALPDYLEQSFMAHFGADTPARIVDSSKKTSNGNSMQWTFGFKATLKNPDDCPAVFEPYLSSTKKSLASTAFIWDLVETYGFSFGKKQDINQIKSKIPTQYITAFEAGLTA